MADTTPNGPQGAGAVQFMMTNKLDTAMWLSRLFTVYCSALFVLPLLGVQMSCFKKERSSALSILTPVN
ncbi:TMEM33 isoform 7 [Pan troglodytes]|uniref:Transmembrane protein 33 n=5 Tax=Homininae TaxID=207598 RepID=D6RBY2_HUMAN|nr:transmembrane protein 33 [Homo sapiens]KAI4025294.1 transmembrane protein 33 [Homo sapiens]PNI83144.1 TMEM33 isoform 7 [Pan troglodytes]